MQYGPQPYAAFISDLCEIFECTPREAERQPYELAMQVIEYRLARAARDAFNDEERRKTLPEHPELMRALDRMARAQQGLNPDPYPWEVPSDVEQPIRAANDAAGLPARLDADAGRGLAAGARAGDLAHGLGG